MCDIQELEISFIQMGYFVYKITKKNWLVNQEVSRAIDNYSNCDVSRIILLFDPEKVGAKQILEFSKSQLKNCYNSNFKTSFGFISIQSNGRKDKNEPLNSKFSFWPKDISINSKMLKQMLSNKIFCQCCLNKVTSIGARVNNNGKCFCKNCYELM